MPLAPRHESHIRRVGVTFELVERDLEPAIVTAVIGIEPDASACRGDVRRNHAGQSLTPHDEGWWAVRTEGKVESKDVNDHFRHLLNLLLSHQEAIRRFVEAGEASFGVLWESTYLYAGTGPMLACDVIAGVARLGAEMAFDIYQINEDEPEEEV